MGWWKKGNTGSREARGVSVAVVVLTCWISCLNFGSKLFPLGCAIAVGASETPGYAGWTDYCEEELQGSLVNASAVAPGGRGTPMTNGGESREQQVLDRNEVIVHVYR